MQHLAQFKGVSSIAKHVVWRDQLIGVVTGKSGHPAKPELALERSLPVGGRMITKADKAGVHPDQFGDCHVQVDLVKVGISAERLARIDADQVGVRAIAGQVGAVQSVKGQRPAHFADIEIRFGQIRRTGHEGDVAA